MPNTYKNKIVVDGTTLIDLTSDTVTADKLMQGYTAHDASGATITGTATGGDSGSAYQDQDGYIVLGDGESTAPQGNIIITANGTYDVTDYAAADVQIPTGETNVVLGEFTASTAGTVQEVSVAYSGSGWPIYIGIYPTGGYCSGNTVYDTNHRYAIVEFSVLRRVAGSSSDIPAYGSVLYKSSDTGMAVTGTRVNGNNLFDAARTPTSEAATCVAVRGKNGFAVFVSDTSFGFLSGAAYKYVIVYSS